MQEVKKIVRKKLIVKTKLSNSFVETINFSGTKLLTNNVCAYTYTKSIHTQLHIKKRGKRNKTLLNKNIY